MHLNTRFHSCKTDVDALRKVLLLPLSFVMVNVQNKTMCICACKVDGSLFYD